MRFLFAALLILTFLMPAPALAKRYLEIKQHGKHLTVGDRLFKPQITTYTNMPEPTIEKVKFLKITPPKTMDEYLGSLLLGISNDVPPEYDHYGYEIRRYMAHIAGPDVLGNPERIKQELANIASAKIVFQYWRKALLKEIMETDKVIDFETSSSNRSKYRYNKGIIKTFLVEANDWLETNEAMLKFLDEHPGAYQYQDPVIIFAQHPDRIKFTELFNAQQKAQAEINKYLPFRLMAY